MNVWTYWLGCTLSVLRRAGYALLPGKLPLPKNDRVKDNRRQIGRASCRERV